MSAFRVHETSSILMVNSDKGYYFLKAVSTASNELVKTVTISKLFENLTVDVVGVCEELGSFVTSGGWCVQHEASGENGQIGSFA